MKLRNQLLTVTLLSETVLTQLDMQVLLDLSLYFVQLTSRINFEVCLDKVGHLMIARHSFYTIFTIWMKKYYS